MMPKFSLSRTPALDGLRGVAILCVLLSHAGLLPVFGGSVIMFALSGFLITSHLMKEYQRTETIQLLDFYARRFRRLIPALLAMLFVVNLVVVVLMPHTAAGLWSDTAYALLYASNWSRVWQTVSTSYLAHLWSLSIEEQFYLVWPMICLTLFRIPARYAALLCALAAIASWMARGTLIAEGAAMTTYYYATFARLDALLMGCGLAFLLHTSAYGWLVQQARRLPRLTACLTLSTACVLAVCLYAYAVPSPQTYNIGMPLVSACVCLLIAACVLPQTTIITRLLGSRLMTHIGLISYGAYLWHWPLLMLMHGYGIESAGVLSAVFGLMAGQASYTWIEAPMRKRHTRAMTNITSQK